MKSFIEEDWTGLSKRQIWSSILAEEEEQQCNEEGHKWVAAYYCSVCGLRSEDALEEMTKKLNKRKSNSRHVKQ